MRTTTRKGFPLPDATDQSTSTFTVGRGLTATGVVRDTPNSISQLADYGTDFDLDEVVTGRWEFQAGTLMDKGQAVLLQNNSGGARASGDVVMLDPANDSAFILPNVASADASRVYVVAETIAALAIGRVTVLGITRVKAIVGTGRGLYLQTQNGLAIAANSAYVTPGSFALSLSGLDSNNTVLAVVHAGGAGGGLEVAEVDAAPDVIGARKLIFPNGSLTDQGSQTVQVNFGSSILRHETYTVTGTTQVLTQVPDTLLEVSKNGIAEQIGVDVTLAGSTLTFTTALSGDVIDVIYITTNSFNPSSAPYVQEFDPAAAATTVVLANIPTVILSVVRNGIPQSTAKGDWTWNAGTAVITFSDAFLAGDHVIVAYSQNFGGGNASTVNNLPAVPSTAPAANSLVATDANGRFPASTMPTTTGFHEEFLPASGTNTVTVSQPPGMILYVTRDGVVQSTADGHYTVAGSVLTFVDAFDGTNRVIVAYILGTNIGAANTVGGFSASSAAVATPGTLVATDAVTGKLPGSILTGFINELVNGGLEQWQRGNGPFTTNGLYGPDRWFLSLGGTSTASITKETTIVDGGGTSAKIVYTHNAESFLIQKLEDNLQVRNRTLTVSARVWCNTANAVSVNVQDGGGTGAGNGPVSANHPGDSAWHTLTASQTFNNAGTAPQVIFNFQVSCTAYIDNVMLVVGATPVDYVPLPPAEGVARCKRYYNEVGNANDGSIAILHWSGAAAQYWEQMGMLMAEMAVPPTFTKVGTWSVSGAITAQPALWGNARAWGMQVTTTGVGTYSVSCAAVGQKATFEANP